jgi:competence protein ComEC
VSPHPDPFPRAGEGGRTAAWPWWGFALLLAAWSSGITAAALLSPLRVWLALALSLATAVALIDRHVALLAGLSLAAFLLGAGRGALAATVELPANLAGQIVSVSGTVDDDPVARKASRRLIVRVDHVVTGAEQTRVAFRIEATFYGMTPVKYGDLVLLTGEIQQPPRFDQFDYRAYLAEQGIAGVIPGARLVRVTSHGGDPLHSTLLGIRHAVVETVDRALPEPQAALLLGVVFGYRAALPPTLQQQMIASGLIHIVVISGLKVSLLARIIQQAVGRFAPTAAPLIAAGAMAGYALLAGASAAALRAAAMGIVVVIAGRLHRDSHVFVSLALTGAVMLGLKPDLAGDVSFQLSFAGTMGIAAMTDRIATWVAWLPAVLRDPFAATIAAEAATWPLMLANFHQLSLIGPIANALVLPLLPVVMVAGGAGAMIGSPIALAGWPLLQAAGMITSWYRLVIDGLGSLPLAAITMPYFPPRWLAAAVVVNVAGLAGVRLRQFFWQKKVWAILGAASLAMVVLLLIRPDGRVHVYALDVGTGSAVLVRTANGHQILIDAGPDIDKLTQAMGRALPPTARTIDVWVIAGGRRVNIGAAPAVLSRFQIGSLVIADPDPWSASMRALVQQAQSDGIPAGSVNGPLEVDGVRLSQASDGRSWLIQTDTAVLAVVPPETSWTSLPAGVSSVIFTSGGPPAWQGPGQGVSVIQVSSNSRAGLPARAVVRALVGAALYRTDRVGTVELVSSAGGFRAVK